MTQTRLPTGRVYFTCKLYDTSGSFLQWPRFYVFILTAIIYFVNSQPHNSTSLK